MPVLLGREHREHAMDSMDDVEMGKLAKVEQRVRRDDRKSTSNSIDSIDNIAAVTTHLKCCEKIVLGIGVVCALAQGVSTPAIAMFTADSITTMTVDDADKEHMLNLMAPTLIKIAVLAAIQFLLAFGWQLCLAWAAARQANRWHCSFVASILSLDVSWYDEHDPAGVAAKLETDIANVYSFMCTGLGYLIASIAQLIGGLSLAFATGWQLALVVSATIPMLMCLGHRLGKEIEHQTFDQQRDFARASAVAEESLMAIRTVAAFGGEKAESARFEKELVSAKFGGIRSGAKIGAAWGGLNFFYSCLYGLSLFFGGHVLLANESFGFDPSQIVTVMIAMLVGVTGLSSFSGFAPMMAKAVVSAKAMKEVITAERVIERPLFTREALPEQLRTVDTIEFRSVSFRYPTRLEKWVLQDFSFRAEKGQKIAFAGESGSGKSTTIQLLERFYDPCGGEVLVNGIHLSQVPSVKA